MPPPRSTSPADSDDEAALLAATSALENATHRRLEIVVRDTVRIAYEEAKCATVTLQTLPEQ